jgi:hypothetical protein
MPVIDYATREARLRFGIAGPAGAGKLTLLRAIHAKLLPHERSEITSAPAGGHTLWSFDYVPEELMPLGEYRARASLLALSDAAVTAQQFGRFFADLDGLLFVADSGAATLPSNVAALAELCGARGLADVPILFFYNKRDLADALPVSEMERRLNTAGAPFQAGSALRGEGIESILGKLARAALAQSS